jgi:hypothetical protein
MFGAVLLSSEFARPVQDFFIDVSIAAVGGQSLGELFGQAIPKLDSLDASLLQQSAACAALRCASNFASID